MLRDFAKRLMDGLLRRALGSSAKTEALWRVVRFGIVGVGVTLLYAVLALAFHYLAGLPAAASSFIAYFFSAACSYFGHRVFTFQDNGEMKRSVPRFIAVNLLGNVLAVGLPWIVSDLLHYPALISIGMVCVGIPAMSYVLLNIFVFHDAQPDTRQPV